MFYGCKDNAKSIEIQVFQEYFFVNFIKSSKFAIQYGRTISGKVKT